MDVSRSVVALTRISTALRIIAWVVLALAVIAAITGANLLNYMPGDVRDTVEKVLPAAVSAGALGMLLMGVINWAVLLCAAEMIRVVLAIESNTRRTAEAVAARATRSEEPASTAGS